MSMTGSNIRGVVALIATPMRDDMMGCIHDEDGVPFDSF